MAYQYLAGSTLTLQSVSDPLIFHVVAAACAKMHAIQELGEPDFIRREPCIWKILRKFQNISPDGFPEAPEKNARYDAKIPFTKVQLANEIGKMETLLGEQNLPTTKVVFAHNDLLLANILVRYEEPLNKTPKISFIDYEYGDYNYREYDIANHFNEFVGMGDENGFLDYPKYYPSKEFQLRWIKDYLRELNKTNEGNNKDPSYSEVEDLQMLVNRFRPLPNLMWGIWALIQSKYSTIDFDFLDYAIQRLGEYKETTQQITT